MERRTSAGKPWEGLGDTLGSFGDALGSLRGVLGSLGDALGTLGGTWENFGKALECLGDVLGDFGIALECFGDALGMFLGAFSTNLPHNLGRRSNPTYPKVDFGSILDVPEPSK